MLLPVATLSTPAQNPGLSDGRVLAEAAATWRERGYVRLSHVLESGLAAELSHMLIHVPGTPGIDESRAELAWRGEVSLPEDRYEPQHAPCLWRLVRFLETDLPPILQAVTGRALKVQSPRKWEVCALRKGSFAEVPSEAPTQEHVSLWLGLTHGSWPQAWGGYRELVDDNGVPVACFPPGWDTLDLVDSRWRDRIPLVKRPVEAVAIRLQAC